ALQVMGGLTTGAVRPVANTITTFVVAEEDRGKAFGIMTSASALGWAMGPSMGGYIGSTTGFRSVFYATALLFLGVAFWTRWAMRGLVLQGEIVRQRRVGQSFRERVRSLRGS
ncbi:MAG: MFS transporter, partial [Candidatus Latescibacterota bacterium]|nr:MFS transporter [Candidatus Latescibacterota bacterium]